MSIPRSLRCSIAAKLLIGCGTIEDNAWTSGIPPEDAYAIRDVVHAAHPECKIYGYHKSSDPAHWPGIYCDTSCRTYLVRRTRSGWKIADVDIVTVVQSRNGSNQSMKPTAPLRNRLMCLRRHPDFVRSRLPSAICVFALTHSRRNLVTLPWLISFSLDEAASLFNGTS